MTLHRASCSTPLGSLHALATDEGLIALSFIDDQEEYDSDGTDSGLHAVFAAIERYFRDGRLPAVETPLHFEIGTPFQQRVWAALRAIPDGRTTTYGELARTLGLSASHARAVGAACAANPIAILIPCHRAVAANGGPGGYRWGLDRKRALLDLEAAVLPGLRDLACPSRSS